MRGESGWPDLFPGCSGVTLFIRIINFLPQIIVVVVVGRGQGQVSRVNNSYQEQA